MAIVEKVNRDVQLQDLIDDKKVVVTKAIIRRDLHLDDADRVECFSKRTIWKEFSSSMASVVICLATGRKFNFSKYIFDIMFRNLDSLSKFLMYPRFIKVLLDHQVDDMTTHNTRYKSPTLTQKVFANMKRVGKGFLGVETPLFDSMLVQSQQQAKAGVKVPITHAQPSTTSAPSPTELQDTTPTPHDTPSQYQPLIPHDSPLQDKPTTPHDSPMPLLTTLMETFKDFRVKRLRRVGDDQRVESSSDIVLGAEERLMKKKLLWMLSLREDKSKDQSTLSKRNVNAASKGVSPVIAPELVSTIKTTLFDDEDVTMKITQTLIKLKEEKARILDEKIAQKLHDKEVQKVAARDEQEKANNEKALDLQRQLDEREDESFKMLRAAKASGSESTQEIPTDDLKEITKEDVKNMLEIVPIPEFKVEALQVKYPIIDWEIHTEGPRKYWKIIMIGEIFSSAEPIEDKERALWVELKRLFEPDANDVPWKLKRYMHAPLTWRLYSNYETLLTVGQKRKQRLRFFTKWTPKKLAIDSWLFVFINGLEAYDGEINLGVEENMISNEYAVKLCLEHEVKKGTKSFICMTKAITDFGVRTITIYPDIDPFLEETEEKEKSNDDWDGLLDFNIDDIPLLGEKGLPPFVCKMRKSSRNKKRAMENLNFFYQDIGTSSSAGDHLTQEEATKEAMPIRMS
nr:hypothetical protein [Tanacetum cinerariifolium]